MQHDQIGRSQTVLCEVVLRWEVHIDAIGQVVVVHGFRLNGMEKIASRPTATARI